MAVIDLNSRESVAQQLALLPRGGENPLHVLDRMDAEAERKRRAEALLCTATHEGSHGLYRTRCGSPVLSISCLPQADTAGRCKYERKCSDPFEEMVACLVGEASDALLFGIGRGELRAPWRDGLDRFDPGTKDRLSAYLAAASLTTNDAKIEELVAGAWKEAQAFVREHEAAVRTLGRMLAKHGELGQTFVRVFAERHGIVERKAASARAQMPRGMPMNIRTKEGSGPVAFADGDTAHPIMARYDGGFVGGAP